MCFKVSTGMPLRYKNSYTFLPVLFDILDTITFVKFLLVYFVRDKTNIKMMNVSIKGKKCSEG